MNTFLSRVLPSLFLVAVVEVMFWQYGLWFGSGTHQGWVVPPVLVALFLSLSFWTLGTYGAALLVPSALVAVVTIFVTGRGAEDKARHRSAGLPAALGLLTGFIAGLLLELFDVAHTSVVAYGVNVPLAFPIACALGCCSLGYLVSLARLWWLARRARA